MNNGQYKTCLEKYGDRNFVNSKLAKQTKKEKYGFENYNNIEQIKQTWNNKPAEEKYKIWKKHFKKFYAPNGKRYDSSWEFLFENYLIEHNIEYEYQPKCDFWYKDCNGNNKQYWPDFKLLKTGEIIEIKGDYFFDKNGNFINPYDKTEEGYKNAELKWKCMVENNVKIYTSKELISLGIDLS